MTTHEIAKKLLEGPDMPACVLDHASNWSEITFLDITKGFYATAGDAWHEAEVTVFMCSY